MVSLDREMTKLLLIYIVTSYAQASGNIYSVADLGGVLRVPEPPLQIRDDATHILYYSAWGLAFIQIADRSTRAARGWRTFSGYTLTL